MKFMWRQSLVAAALAAGAFLGAVADTTNAPAWRDPFWPVGYRPPPPEEEAKKAAPEAKPEPPPPPKPKPDWAAARKLLNVTAYGEKDNDKSCLLNGEFVKEGDLVSVIYKSMRYTWRIRHVDRHPDKMRYEQVEFAEPKKSSQK